MRRLIALFAALMLLAAAGHAQEMTGHELSREEVHGVVDMLFAAAAGTTLELETAAREGLTMEEELARNEQAAAYRRLTLPWLAEAFRPESELSDPTPMIEPVAAPHEEEEPPVTIEDSYAALCQNELGETYLMVMRSYGGVDARSCMEATQRICRQWIAEIDHERLRSQNEDYACWIYAQGTQIDYPVVQGEDNAYYLERLFDRRKNASGTLFMDYRNLPDFQDPNTLIYGHHMRNRSMFGMLDEYDTQAFYESHPFMLLVTPQGTSVLELFSAYTTDSSDHCYNIAVGGSDLERFVEKAKQKSDFSAAVTVEETDHLVTLSTCAYAFENARYVVIGRLVNENEWTYMGE